MTQTFPTLEELPESLCSVAQNVQHLPDAEHVPHVIYAGNTSIRIGRCPGVGTFETVVTPPADPFWGCDD
jgi:hypothetical protein